MNVTTATTLLLRGGAKVLHPPGKLIIYECAGINYERIRSLGTLSGHWRHLLNKLRKRSAPPGVVNQNAFRPRKPLFWRPTKGKEGLFRISALSGSFIVPRFFSVFFWWLFGWKCDYSRVKYVSMVVLNCVLCVVWFCMFWVLCRFLHFGKINLSARSRD